MLKIFIFEELVNKLKMRLQNNCKLIPLYGHYYPDEELIQIWDIKNTSRLQEVGSANFGKEGGFILIQNQRISLDEITVIPYYTEFTSRAEGIIDTQRLSKKQVTLIGLGSIGSNLAVYLAKASVGKFRLIDMDTLSASNVSRHACDLHYLGRQKTKAVKDLIFLRNPMAHVETFEEDFLGISFDTQIKRIEGSDLVIASTDSNACQFMVNEVCLHLNIPSIYIGCYERAQAGEVVFVIPGKTPCFNCLMEFRAGALNELKRKARHIPYSDEKGDGLHSEPGLAIDIMYTTAVASAFTLALLDEDSERRALLDPNRNLILLHSGNKPKGKYADIFQMPFDYIVGKTTRRTGCEVCQGINYKEQD